MSGGTHRFKRSNAAEGEEHGSASSSASCSPQCSRASRRRPFYFQKEDMTTPAAATELQPGAFVRVQLPKKNSWGSYRVERIEDGAIELLEFWQRDEGLVWWVGSVTRIAAIDRLEGLEIRDSVTPILGSSTRFCREGPEQTR